MDTDISTALSLLAIGMITVFVVLTLVVFTGKLMIAIANLFPKETAIPIRVTNQGIENNKIAAITAAVEAFTEGRGSIQKIEKL